MTVSPLTYLSRSGVAVWLDDLSRPLVRTGGLARLVTETGLIAVEQPQADRHICECRLDGSFLRFDLGREEFFLFVVHADDVVILHHHAKFTRGRARTIDDQQIRRRPALGFGCGPVAFAAEGLQRQSLQ